MALFDIKASDHTAGIVPVPLVPPTTVTLFSKKVMVVLPWQKQTNPMTSFCVAQIMDRRRTASVLNFGDAFITHSRNTCADVFLSSTCDYMLMIDDDMLVPFGSPNWFNAHSDFNLVEPFASFNALDRLMSHGKTLVGALYFGRHRTAKAVYCEAMSNEKENDYARGAPYNQVKPTKWVGTGCMLVHRTVFEAIETRFPRLARGADKKGGQWFTSTEASFIDSVERAKEALEGPLNGEKAYNALTLLEGALATAKHENALGCGEDVSFCLRASAAGHQAHIDMGLVCGHLGHCCYGPKNTGVKKIESPR